jgi:hypothetical protein
MIFYHPRRIYPKGDSTVNTTPKTAPQFISALQEAAEETLVAYLRSMQAPEQIISLAQSQRLLDLDPHPETVVETINLVVACGGVFHTASGTTTPHNLILWVEAPAEVLK